MVISGLDTSSLSTSVPPSAPPENQSPNQRKIHGILLGKSKGDMSDIIGQGNIFIFLMDIGNYENEHSILHLF